MAALRPPARARPPTERAPEAPLYRSSTVTVCFPCRNEGAHLAGVIGQVPSFVDEVLVVSNRSSDDTVSVAAAAGARVEVDDRTLRGVGYGYAHMTGLAHAKGDLVVCADGDATYPVQELEGLLDFLLDGRYDVVSCSRYPVPATSRIPLRLQLGVRLLNAEVRLLYGWRVNDILSGMWVVRASAVEELALTMGDWNLSPQLKLNALANPRLRFAEHPISQRQRHGESHQRHLRTGVSHAWWILRNRFGPAARRP